MKGILRFIFRPLKRAWSIPRNSTWYGLFPFPTPPKGPFPYTNDPSISDEAGRPLTPRVSYVPKSMVSYRKSKLAEILTTIFVDQFSNFLFEENQRILSNYFLGIECFRLHYYGAFGPSALISIENNGGTISLHGKHLLWGDIYDPDYPIENPRASVETICEKEIRTEEWEYFLGLLSACEFWSLAPHWDRIGIDGEAWEMEGHVEAGYWYVGRHCPKDSFEQCGRYLFELCGFPQPNC